MGRPKHDRVIPERFCAWSGAGVAEASAPDGIPGIIGFYAPDGEKRRRKFPRQQSGSRNKLPSRRQTARLPAISAARNRWLFAAAWFGGDVFILRQVSALVGTARQLEKGNLTQRVGPPYGKGELGRLAQSFDQMAVSLQKNAVQLHYQVTHDSFTGLPNRNSFKEQLESEIAAVHASSGFVALLLMDLDSFKEINDTIGHRNGDRLLNEVTERLKNTVGQGGLVARLGGDEFSIVLLNTDIESATYYARKIISAFHEPFVLDELPIAVELSLGIALYPRDADLLIRRAEVAMYHAKEAKSGYAFYALLEKDQYRPERLAFVG